jgi:demethylmenaquinone methyltransferase / 2-methoxy-6-polyprenyl-1,4-benzoquinol methylase
MQKQYVRSLFDSIARRYDLLNHLLSGGVDLYWRRKAINTLKPLQPRRILDVATGTGDFAIAALRLRPEQVVAVDFAEGMLAIARKKVLRKGLEHRILLLQGDAEALDLPPESFDAAIVAFGVRNFENLERGLFSMYRMVRRGGKIAILEFSRPQSTPFRQIYFFYFRSILPRIGRTVSNHPEAYEYLPDTVMKFPEGAEFRSILERVGFRNTEEQRLTGGIATVYTGEK